VWFFSKRVEKMNTPPRSENPDLGHPYLLIGWDGEMGHPPSGKSLEVQLLLLYSWQMHKENHNVDF
jgi:hypothetical protein